MKFSGRVSKILGDFLPKQQFLGLLICSFPFCHFIYNSSELETAYIIAGLYSKQGE